MNAQYGTDAGYGGGDSGFGDDGHFIADDRAPANPRSLNWPTILASAGVAAVVSSVILSIGIVGMHRDDAAASAEPAVVRVVTDSGQAATQDPAAASEPATAPADGKSPATATPPAAGAAAGGGAAASPSIGGGGSPAPQAAPAPDPHPEGAAVGPAPQEDARQGGASEEGAAPDGGITAWSPASTLPADYAVTAADPSLADLNNIVYFITATPASDEAKARNIEAGMGGVIVPKTVYNLGLFRAPRGWSRVTGPMQRSGDSITVQLHAFSAGMPGVDMPITFVRQDGVWKLASSSLCAGVRTVGLPIYCNA